LWYFEGLFIFLNAIRFPNKAWWRTTQDLRIISFKLFSSSAMNKKGFFILAVVIWLFDVNEASRVKEHLLITSSIDMIEWGASEGLQTNFDR
jgi:hypothetical protein